jgi:hypothetical protein
MSDRTKKYITEADVTQAIDRSVTKLNNFMWGMVAVFLISFVSFILTVTDMAIDRYQSRIEATNDLRESVVQLNTTLLHFISISVPSPANATITP